MEFLKTPPFSTTDHRIENPGNAHQRNIPRSSYMKFYPIWSISYPEMALDGWTFLGEELSRSNCSLFNTTPQADFLIPLIPNSNPIPTRWTECNPIETKCTLTLTSQSLPRQGGLTFLGEERVGSNNCSLFIATQQIDFLTPLIPNPNPIPT